MPYHGSLEADGSVLPSSPGHTNEIYGQAEGVLYLPFSALSKPKKQDWEEDPTKLNGARLTPLSIKSLSTTQRNLTVTHFHIVGLTWQLTFGEPSTKLM